MWNSVWLMTFRVQILLSQGCIKWCIFVLLGYFMSNSTVWNKCLSAKWTVQWICYQCFCVTFLCTDFFFFGHLCFVDNAEYYKEIIQAFFMHHKMNIKRLRRIVLKLLSEDGKKPGKPLELNLSELHSQISSWVSSATAAQIRQLPDIVIKVGASSIGEKLQKKLNQTDASLTESCNLDNMVEKDLFSA